MKKIFGLIMITAVFWTGAFPVGAQLICPLDSSAIKPKEVKNLSTFGRLPILDEGRVKPLDTYARTLLLRFSGRTAFNKKPAINWLARLLFAPEHTKKDEIFLINHPDIPTALGLTAKKRRRYSFSEIEPAFPKLAQLAQVAGEIDKKERSLVDHEILRVYENIILYAKLSSVFTFAFPHADFQINHNPLKERLGLPRDQNFFSFIALAANADKLYELSKDLEHKAKSNWTPGDHEMLPLLSNIFNWSMSYQGLPFTIIPSANPQDEVWYAPWDTIGHDFQNPKIKSELVLLANMTARYWNGEQLAFDMAARAFSASLKSRANEEKQKVFSKLNLEYAYTRFHAFDWAKGMYLLTLVVFILSVFIEKKFLHTLAFGLIVAGLLPHGIAIVMRVFIMSRPPVSSLYETFIFVSFLTVLIGLFIERVHKRWLGLLVSGLSGVALLTIASKYAAEGDTLQMLVAVLNSNFWLSTHVITITAGYAATCVAGLIGHIYIIQQILRPKDKTLLAMTYKHLVFTLALALLLTFFGTALGGIWADQSWGRFWGWDPKENGALMIVLWCALTFHAKIAKLVGSLGFAAFSAAGIMVVMWAWFGVNLLSIGLHSYGFTSGIALTLGIYFILEIVFLLLAIPAAKAKSMISTREGLK